MDPSMLQQLPQAPQVPQMPPEQMFGAQDPSTGLEDQPISDEQKQELLDMINKIQAKIDDVGALKFASDKKLDIFRQQMLGKVFDGLQMSGVDLSNRESVSNFMNELRSESPELADMFEKSLDALLGEPVDMGGPTEQPTEAPQDPAMMGMPPEDPLQNMNIQNTQNEGIPKG